MKTALISVSDKNNLKLIVDNLLSNNYQIISTGGTYSFIESFVNESYKKFIKKIEDFTEFPEILEGRVKTLHPKVFGGILYDPCNDSHKKDMDNYQLKLSKIDLVVVNLYPFNKDINDESEAIEKIDIGGVSLIRAAAKNYKNVIILTDPADYINYNLNYQFIESSMKSRKDLAAKAFEHVTEYDQEIASYFNPRKVFRKYEEIKKLKYGCNPYQTNSFSLSRESNPIEILSGDPGYINYLDAINSWCLVTEAKKSLGYVIAASFKHTSPAGVGTSKHMISDSEKKVYDLEEFNPYTSETSRAFIRARNSDPLSSFGDFISISGVVDKDCALLIKREVSDGIIAEDYTTEALEILKKKKSGKYIVMKGDKNIEFGKTEYREICGIVLSQKNNDEIINKNYLRNIVTTNNNIPDDKKEDLILSTITLKYTPSNSIVISDNCHVIGVGSGQQNRVDCIKIAGNKALTFKLRFEKKCLNLLKKFKKDISRQDKTNAIIKYINNDFISSEFENWMNNFEKNSSIEMLDDKETFRESLKNLCLSSDAFFPFRDNIDYSARYGVTYILNPGGSVQDVKIVEACNEYNICMAISGKRLFLH